MGTVISLNEAQHHREQAKEALRLSQVITKAVMTTYPRTPTSKARTGGGGSNEGPNLSRSVEFSHEGRQLQLRTRDVGNTVQVWIFEQEIPLELHSAISLELVVDAEASGQDVIDMVMQAARSAVEKGKLILPSR
jgi:hypothetical protein